MKAAPWAIASATVAIVLSIAHIAPHSALTPARAADDVDVPTPAPTQTQTQTPTPAAGDDDSQTQQDERAAPRPGRIDQLPDELEGVGVTSKLNEQVPLDLPFRDEQGELVELRRYFDGKTPVILQLGYYRCPMLCNLVMNGMADALRDLSLDPADEYQIVSISIDPSETPRLAREKKKSYVADLGNPAFARGWHFLTSEGPNAKILAEAVGFHYKYIQQRGQFSHPATIIICTPDGRISRYLSGIKYDPRTVRLSLVEASEGKIGSFTDQFVLSCFQYNPDAGSYSVAALGIMRVGGVLTVIILAAVIGVALLREKYARRRREQSGHDESNPASPSKA